jgi:hypothetical protein
MVRKDCAGHLFTSETRAKEYASPLTIKKKNYRKASATAAAFKILSQDRQTYQFNNPISEQNSQ